MKETIKFRNQNIFLIVLGIVVCAIYGGRDSNYWGLIKKEKSGKEILYEVGMGYVNPDSIKLILPPQQKKEIRDLINKNPLEHNEAEKSLLKEKSGEKILYEVGMGYLNPKNVKLSPQQRKEITDIINKNPSLHNEAEKSLLLKK